MSDFVLVFCTVDSKKAAQGIAKTLVESKLAACVNIIDGVSSVYSWKGEIVEDNEILLIVKSKASLFEKLQNKIKEIHPYEVPEIISTKVDEGYIPYLNWIDENTL